MLGGLIDAGDTVYLRINNIKHHSKFHKQFPPLALSIAST